jgi:D-alanine-D-alanine ligase
MNNNGELFFLEINFTCSVFYKDGYEGSADYILKYDGYGQANFLKHIIAEGMARHQQKQKKYYVKGSPIAGYGIYASEKINANELLPNAMWKKTGMLTKRKFLENTHILSAKKYFCCGTTIRVSGLLKTTVVCPTQLIMGWMWLLPGIF